MVKTKDLHNPYDKKPGKIGASELWESLQNQQKGQCRSRVRRGFFLEGHFLEV
jgi:hypothetical protein